MKNSSGFTLIELMITLAIVGTLLTVGVPSLRTFLQNNQLIAATNELLSAIHIARSEAIKQNIAVTVCESSNGSSCSATGNWENGWIVFVDSNYDLANTGGVCTASNTDCLLRIHDGFDASQLTVSGLDVNDAAISSFTFTSRGRPRSAIGASQFSLCSLGSDGATVNSRAVVLSITGRVRVSDNSAVISCL
jgi:type IV fimbrial biogenesis protein FimT